MLKFDLFEQTTKTSKGMLHNAGNESSYQVASFDSRDYHINLASLT